MKALINKLFRALGFAAPFSVILQKQETTDANHSKAAAWKFVSNALKKINNQLYHEIKANGFDPNEIRDGKITLVFSRTQDPLDEGVFTETYTIGKVEIMAVDWKPNGFSIRVRQRAEARQTKRILTNGIQADKGRSGLVVGNNGLIKAAENINPEIEAKAQEYLKQFRGNN
jgi:hypothetical protein